MVGVVQLAPRPLRTAWRDKWGRRVGVMLREFQLKDRQVAFGESLNGKTLQWARFSSVAFYLLEKGPR